MTAHSRHTRGHRPRLQRIHDCTIRTSIPTAPLDSIDEGFSTIEVLFDVNGRACDYRFLELNPGFEKHTGLAEALGKTAQELVPNLAQHWFEVYGDLALTGEPARFVNSGEVLGFPTHS
jgi:hypothetical protein